MEPNTTKHLMILGETFGQMGFPSEYLTNQQSLGSCLWNQNSIVQTHKIISVWNEEIKKHHPIFTCLGVSPKHVFSKKQPITCSAIFLQDDHQISLIRSEIAGRIVNLLDVVSAIQSYVTLIHEFGWLGSGWCSPSSFRFAKVHGKHGKKRLHQDDLSIPCVLFLTQAISSFQIGGFSPKPKLHQQSWAF